VMSFTFNSLCEICVRNRPRACYHSRVPYHYATLDHDAETGTEHAGARQYSSTQGRWLSPDSYGYHARRGALRSGSNYHGGWFYRWEYVRRSQE